MTFKKTKLVLGIATATLTMSAAFLSPEALAHHSAKKHTHKAKSTKHSHSSYTASSSYHSESSAVQQQLNALQNEVAALRASSHAPAPDTAKIEELDQWMATVKAAPVVEKTRDNLMFFRGGYAHANSQRGGTLDPTNFGTAGNINGLITGPIASKDAWYFGAGFDFGLSNDLFGLMDNTQLAAELMFDYKQYGSRGANGLNTAIASNVMSTGINGGVLPAINTQTSTASMFTLGASPKIKFMKNSSFNPWIIPVGFELNVISPPSNAITVLNPGLQFGLGADYKVWKSIYVGADARYHQALGRLDGINTSGVSAGGYVGFGF